MGPFRYVALLLILTGCEEADVLGERSPLAVSRTRLELTDDLRALATAAGTEVPEPAPEVRDELYELGKLLAHDKLLSGNMDTACMTCHVAGLGTDDDLSLAIGTGGEGVGSDRQLAPGAQFIPRSAPSLFNLHLTTNKFWDGRVSFDAGAGTYVTPAGAALTQDMTDVFEFGTVSAQALFPPTDRREMRGEIGESELGDLPDGDYTAIWAGIMARIGAIPEYVTRFEAAYPGTAFDDMTFAHAANAIAGYEVRAFDRADSPFDQFLAQIPGTLSRGQLRGGIAFYSVANCQGCHSGPNLSNQVFFNSGVPQIGPGLGDGPTATDDYGRERVSLRSDDRHRFRSSPLRNVEVTAPYGHAGQYRNLRQLMLHYQEPEATLLAYDVVTQLHDTRVHGLFVDNRAEVLATMSPVMLNANIPDDLLPELVAFMHALTDDSVFDLCAEVPSTVPSGLSIDDPCIVP